MPLWNGFGLLWLHRENHFGEITSKRFSSPSSILRKALHNIPYDITYTAVKDWNITVWYIITYTDSLRVSNYLFTMYQCILISYNRHWQRHLIILCMVIINNESKSSNLVAFHRSWSNMCIWWGCKMVLEFEATQLIIMVMSVVLAVRKHCVSHVS